MAATLQQLVRVRSRRTDEVLEFLRLYGQLLLGMQRRTLRFQPQKSDRLACLLPRRVISCSDWMTLVTHRRKMTGIDSRDEWPDPEPWEQEMWLKGTRRIMPRPLQLPPGRASKRLLRCDPGGGKSTALWLYVREVCDLFAAKVRSFDVSIDDPTIALPLVLWDSVGIPEGPDGLATVLVAQSRKLLKEYHCDSELFPQGGLTERVRTWLEDRIAKGHFELCADVFDKPCPPKKIDWWLSQFPSRVQFPILATAGPRHEDDSAAALFHGYDCFRLVPLDRRETAHFINQSCKHVVRNPRIMDDLQHGIPFIRGMRKLSQMPGILHAYCENKSRARGVFDPTKQSEVLQIVFHAILNEGNQTQSTPESHLKKEAAFRELAMQGFDPTKGLTEITASNLKTLIEIPNVVTEFVQKRILVTRDGGAKYRIWPPILHEYGIACALAEIQPNAARLQFWAGRMTEGKHAWRNILPLLGGLSPEHLDWIIDAVWPSKIRKKRKNAMNVSLIASVIREAGTKLARAVEVIQDISRQLKAATNEKDLQRARMLIDGLAIIGDKTAFEAILDQYRSSHTPEEIRCWCARKLARFGNIARETLKPGMRGGASKIVSAACAYGLADIGDSHSIQQLKQVLRDAAASVDLRVACAVALQGFDAAGKNLRKILWSEAPPELQLACLTSLYWQGDSTCQTELAGVSKRHPNEHVKSMARSILGWLGKSSSPQSPK